MNEIKLTNLQMADVVGGEPFTLAAIMTVLAIAIVAVIVYRLFMSTSGSTTIPGGFKFDWK